MAIAYDSSANNTANPGTSVTVSHTCSGDNRLLLVGILTNDSSDKVTGATYNSVALTRLASQAGRSLGFYNFVYYLVGPASGTNNLVISRSDNNLIGGMSASYTGVSQSGFPDSSANYQPSPGNFSATTTVVASNCWLFANVRNFTLVASGTTTKRQEVFGDAGIIADSNGTVGTGSQSLTFTSSPGNEGNVIVCSFAPATDAVNTPIPPQIITW